jgi:hypothetical protein
MWLTSTCCPRALWSAASVARLTSAPTSCRLYCAEPRISDWGSATARAASAADSMSFGVICWPRSAASPSRAAAQRDGNLFAVIALQAQLHGSARGRINWGTPFEGDVRATAVFRRDVDDNFRNDFVGGERRCISILQEFTQLYRALPRYADASYFARKRQQHRGPIAARVGLGNRTADRASISDLHVSNSRSAITQNRNLCSSRRIFDLGMPCKRAEMQSAILQVNVRYSVHKIQIDKMSGVGKT